MSRPARWVCQRCGVRVIRFLDSWKHQTGGGGAISCRRPPIVVDAAQYAKELKAAVDHVKHRK